MATQALTALSSTVCRQWNRWNAENSTTTKVLVLASCLLGWTVTTSLSASWALRAVATLAAGGITALVASSRFSQSTPVRRQQAPQYVAPRYVESDERKEYIALPLYTGPRYLAPRPQYASIQDGGTSLYVAVSPPPSSVPAPAVVLSAPPPVAHRPQYASIQDGGTSLYAAVAPPASSVPAPAAAAAAPAQSGAVTLQTQALWENLQKETAERLKGMQVVAATDVLNRFPNVLCPAHTAISTKGEHPYFHANHVTICDRHFIVSQAPLSERQPAASKQSLSEFWQAVFQERPSTIFALTSWQDHNSGLVPKYYEAKDGETREFGSLTFRVTTRCIPTDEQDPIRIRTCSLGEGPQHEHAISLNHFHFLGWPDHGVVDFNTLHTLVARFDESSSSAPDRVVWLHCVAGVGRSGTLLTAWALREKVRREMIQPEDDLDKALVGTILELRAQRGNLFVQNPQQLQLLGDYLRFCVDCK